MKREKQLKINRPRVKSSDAERAKDFFISACIRGAEELRKKLHIDENGYRRVVGWSHYNTRDFYIYGVLDEIEKVGTVLLRYEKLLKGEIGEIKGRDDRVARNVITAILNEQALWLRKLSEILVEVINFLETNTRGYFKHYLLLRQYEAYAKLKGDFKVFYNCDNKNIDYSMDKLERNIIDTETKPEFDINKCWYLSSKEPWFQKTSRQKKHPFSNFRRRFEETIKKCSAAQKSFLRFSYENYYTKPSRGIHLNIGGPGYNFSICDVEIRMRHISLLGAHILIVCKRLIGARPKQGVVAQINRVFKNDTYIKELVKKKTRPKIRKGDFVVAHNDLGEVIKVNTSLFGYKSFGVKYLSTLSIPTIPEDELPAEYVKLLLKREDVVRDTRQVLKGSGPNLKISSKFLADSLRKHVLNVWENLGLKEDFFGRPDLAKQKIEKYLADKNNSK